MEDKKQMKILKPSCGKFCCFGKVVAYEKWSHMKVRLQKQNLLFQTNPQRNFEGGT